MIKLVVIESPYAGDVEANLTYARRAMAHSLSQGESPFASHLLYTQVGVLDDNDPVQRRRGIEAGFDWGQYADLVAFYLDRGWSEGMRAAEKLWQSRGVAIEYRYLDNIEGGMTVVVPKP